MKNKLDLRKTLKYGPDEIELNEEDSKLNKDLDIIKSHDSIEKQSTSNLLLEKLENSIRMHKVPKLENPYSL